MQPKTIEKIKFFFARVSPQPIFKILLFFRIIYKNIRMHEQKKSFGKLHPDKTFYVIRLYPPATGWLANYNYVLGYIKHALDRDLIPIVDMEHYATLYTEKKAVNGTKNVWEYFFKQPSPYTLEEVYKSKTVILSNGSLPLCDTSMASDVLIWQRKISSLVPFNQTVQKHIEKTIQKTLPQGKRILGVPTRGSEQSKRVIGHHIPITVQEIVPIITQKIQEWHIDYVFVKAEEQETIDYLQEHIPNLLFTDCKRIVKYTTNSAVPASNANVRISQYQNLVDYMTDIYILSQCTSLLGTMNNGFYTALLWNNAQFEHVEIIDRGIYK